MAEWLHCYMVKKYITLGDVEAYKTSFNLSNKFWEISSKWDHFSKHTVGDQFIRALDSISANIAEGFGRYHKKDKEKFYYNARGSTYECLDWLEKSHRRNLVDQNQYKEFFQILVKLPQDINSLIKYTESKLSK
jgi:four helix bundle protein